MEKQRWEESEKRREEERLSDKKNLQKKDSGPRKGRKAPFQLGFPMTCCCGGSKSRLAKETKPSGQMRDHKLHAVPA